jgi:hypothetical protein
MNRTEQKTDQNTKREEYQNRVESTETRQEMGTAMAVS